MFVQEAAKRTLAEYRFWPTRDLSAASLTVETRKLPIDR